MATTAFKGELVHTVGELPGVGTHAPDFILVGSDLSDVTSAGFAGKPIVLNIFPSLDTGVCANTVREFNKRAAGLENAVVICVSDDLPFAAERFCVAEGIENVVTGSAFRSRFGSVYGVTMADGPLAGLLARSVVVIDADGTVVYTELVPEIATEPDYDSALRALD
ncbi:thiol peroxidase [Ancrocorticia populi]|uniref:Thiol peroxidase n=1 Tax=Ancrocorticia populi TaxID=2175228 RepID=A0A2V1K8P8_9ACTO|nr:thiol peroxidase [Ancrocorticia populi]PWF26068.1 thiol peroxidase [Ancrocorticia populi]